MLTIAICDDNPQFARVLSNHLRLLCATKVSERINCEIAPLFGSGKEVMDYLEHNTINVLFLDIDMPQQSGFDIAKVLCDKYPDIIIIFVSSYEDFVYASFEFSPFRFLRKSCLKKELDITFEKVIEKYISDNENMLFSTTDGELLLRVNDITFIEGAKKLLHYKHSIKRTVQMQRYYGRCREDVVSL